MLRKKERKKSGKRTILEEKAAPLLISLRKLFQLCQKVKLIWESRFSFTKRERSGRVLTFLGD